MKNSLSSAANIYLSLFLFFVFFFFLPYFIKGSLALICLIFTTPDQTTHSVCNPPHFLPRALRPQPANFAQADDAEDDSQLLQTGQQTRG